MSAPYFVKYTGVPSINPIVSATVILSEVALVKLAVVNSIVNSLSVQVYPPPVYVLTPITGVLLGALNAGS
jgi:hypothetical protein